MCYVPIMGEPMEIQSMGAVVACIGLLSACTNPAEQVVQHPSNVSLRTALITMVDALAAARAESQEIQERGVLVPVVVHAPTGAVQQGNSIVYESVPVGPIGINTCSVTATFNIAVSGSATTSEGGTVDILRPIDSTLSISNSDASTASRGNQIAVTFTTPACNPAGALGTTAPWYVTLLQREIEAARTGGNDPINWQPTLTAISSSGTNAPLGSLSSLNGKPPKGNTPLLEVLPANRMPGQLNNDGTH